MIERRKILRSISNGAINGNVINGLWDCKRACDLKHIFNKSMREACKTKCEEDNILKATTLYPSTPTPTSTTTTMPPSTFPNGDGLIMGLDQNDLLLYGGGALALLFLMKKKKKKKKRR